MNKKETTKDKTQKVLESNNDVFADIWNVLLFGNNVINEDELEVGATDLIAYGEERFRDVCKIYKKMSLNIATLGIENQSRKDNTMPIRVMGYDFLEYERQLKEVKRRRLPYLYPSITIVLNYSFIEWKKPTELFQCLRMKKDIEPFVSNHKFHIINVAFLTDEQIDSLQSDFKTVAMVLRDARLKNIHISKYRQELKHEDDTLKAITAILHDKRLEEAYRIRKNKQGGNHMACEAMDIFLDELRQEVIIKVREEVRDEVEREVRSEVEKEVRIDAVKILLTNQCDEEFIEKLQYTKEEIDQAWIRVYGIPRKRE